MASGPRILLAVLSALVLFAQAGHWTLTSHSYCATHAAFSHDDHDDDHAETAHDSFSKSDADDEHDHCATTVTPAQLSEVPEHIASAQLLAFAPPSPPAPARHTTKRLYLLAPKTSPPTPESLS